MITQAKLAELREKAEKATPDERVVYLGFDRFSTAPGCYGAYIEVGNSYNFLASNWSDADKDYYCVTNPATVLSLLDTIEILREGLVQANIFYADDSRRSRTIRNTLKKAFGEGEKGIEDE